MLIEHLYEGWEASLTSEASIEAPAKTGSTFDQYTDYSMLAVLLDNKHSKNTRRAYTKDIHDFFETVVGQKATELLLQELFGLTRKQVLAIVLKYQQDLRRRGLAEATINRRLAAIRSLFNYAFAAGFTEHQLPEIKGGKAKAIRDSSGVTADEFNLILESVDRTTLKGKRDYAIVRLLWDNALRRAEISTTKVSYFDRCNQQLKIHGKGDFNNFQILALNPSAAGAIDDWLVARKFECDWTMRSADAPLFCALDKAYIGHQLTGTAIYKIFRGICEQAGIAKVMSPHRARHSAITAALDATNGNVRAVQKFSRHANITTLMMYDDARHNSQKDITHMLEGRDRHS